MVTWAGPKLEFLQKIPCINSKDVGKERFSAIRRDPARNTHVQDIASGHEQKCVRACTWCQILNLRGLYVRQKDGKTCGYTSCDKRCVIKCMSCMAEMLDILAPFCLSLQWSSSSCSNSFFSSSINSCMISSVFIIFCNANKFKRFPCSQPTSR